MSFDFPTMYFVIVIHVWSSERGMCFALVEILNKILSERQNSFLRKRVLKKLKTVSQVRYCEFLDNWYSLFFLVYICFRLKKNAFLNIKNTPRAPRLS